MQSWQRRLASVLEWSITDKSILLMGLVTPILIGYILSVCLMLGRPDVDRLAHVGPLRELLHILIAFTVGALAIGGAGLAMRRKRPDSLALQYVSTLYYAAVLVISSYYVGTLTFCTGVVVLGAPVFGFILLERRVVWTATLLAIAALLGLSYATAFGLLPYAPIVAPPTDAASNLFWMNRIYLLTAPHLIVILFMADQTLLWWRQREDLVRQLSLTDPLTGIANRRHILDLLEREVSRTLRHGPPLAVIVLDLDHFKRINDTWGHPAGDRVLQEAAAALSACVRRSDGVGRFGGEEFMLLLPDTPLEGALTMAERCRARLEAMEIRADNGERIPVTGSFGVACNEQALGVDTEALVKAADAALYRAKAAGRNRVEVEPPLPAT